MLGESAVPSALAAGKMLRTRFAARLIEGASEETETRIEKLCAAVEMVHTASLCHDDVIDHAQFRRGRPSLWRATGASGAILLGDLLLCEALKLLLEVDGGRYVAPFVDKLTEFCTAEIEQEIGLRGKPLDACTCQRLARGKTGPLFAFLGHACGGGERALCAALEEAGYLAGTAYQLADDLVDVLGEERVTGKTLGTDAERGKFTLASHSGDGAEATRERISRLYDAALARLSRWPHMRKRLAAFLADDLQPVFERHVGLHIEIKG